MSSFDAEFKAATRRALKLGGNYKPLVEKAPVQTITEKRIIKKVYSSLFNTAMEFSIATLCSHMNREKEESSCWSFDDED